MISKRNRKIDKKFDEMTLKIINLSKSGEDKMRDKEYKLGIEFGAFILRVEKKIDGDYGKFYNIQKHKREIEEFNESRK